MTDPAASTELLGLQGLRLLKPALLRRTEMRDALATIYVIWRNDFLTVGAFADYYHITDAEAEVIINLGRRFHKELNESHRPHP